MEVLLAFIYIFFGLLFLGMIIAFSPTLIFTELAILTKSKEPFKLSAAFISGIALPVLVFVALAFTMYNPSTEIVIPKSKEILSITPIIDVFAGVVLLVAGVKMGKSHIKESRFDTEKLFSFKAIFLFGAVKMATSLSSIAAILIAARFLKTSTTYTTQQYIGILWLIIAAMLPFIIIVLIDFFSPKSFTRIKKYSDRISELNWSRIMALTFQVGGIILMVYGIINIHNSVVI